MKIKSKPWEIIIAVIIVGFIIWLLVPHHYNVSKDSSEVGKIYQTRQALYLYQNTDFGPLSLEVPGNFTAPLEKVKGEKLPYESGNGHIIKIIPKEVTFKITHVKKIVRIPRSDISTLATFMDKSIYSGEVEADLVLGKGYFRYVDEVKNNETPK